MADVWPREVRCGAWVENVRRGVNLRWGRTRVGGRSGGQDGSEDGRLAQHCNSTMERSFWARG